jgi:hypothetical protein
MMAVQLIRRRQTRRTYRQREGWRIKGAAGYCKEGNHRDADTRQKGFARTRAGNCDTSHSLFRLPDVEPAAGNPVRDSELPRRLVTPGTRKLIPGGQRDGAAA